MSIGKAKITIEADAKPFEGSLLGQVRGLGDKVVGGIGKSIMGGVAAVGAAAGGVLGVALFKGFDRLQSIEQAEAKLSGLGHSTEGVAKIMDNALKAVEGTAYGMGDAASIAATMVAAGVKPGDELTRVLSLVGDSAQIAGVSMGEMGAIWSKAAATGKVGGEIMAQIGERGIPILQMLADHYGVTAEEASKMVSKGEVDFATFADVMEGTLGGAAKKGGETFAGGLANVQAALGRLGEKMLEPAFKQAPDLFANLITALNALGPAAEQVGALLGKAFSWAAEHLTNFANRIPDLINKATELVNLFRTGDFTSAFREAFNVEEDSALVGWLFTIRDAFLRVKDTISSAGSGISFEWLAGVGVVIGGLIGHFSKFSTVITTLFPSISKLAPLFRMLTGPIGILVTLLTAAYASNETFREGVNGLLTVLGALAGQLLSALVPVLMQLAQALLPPIMALFQALATVVGTLLTAITPLIAQFVSALVPVLMTLISAVLPIIVQLFQTLVPVIMQLATAILPVLVQTFQMVMEVVMALLPIIMQLVTTLVGILVPAIQALLPIVQTIFQGIATVIQALLPIVQTIFQGIATVIQAALGIIQGIINVVMGVISGDWGRVWDGIKQIMSNVWTIISTVISTALSVIKGVISAGWNVVKSIFSAAWNAIKSALSAAWNAIKSTISNGINSARSTISNVMSSIRSTFSSIWNSIRSTISNVLSGIRSSISNAMSNVRSSISNAMSTVRTTFSNAWNAIKTTVSNAVSNVMSTVRGIPGKIKSALGNMGGLLRSAGRDVIQGLINGITSMIGNVGSAMSGIAGKIRNFLPFSPVKEGPLRAWNGGKPGKTLMGMLADGISSGAKFPQGAMDRAMSALSDITATPTIDVHGSGPRLPGAALRRAGLAVEASTVGASAAAQPPAPIQVTIETRDLTGLKTVEDFIRMVEVRAKMSRGVEGARAY